MYCYSSLEKKQRLVSVSAIYVSCPRRYFRPNYASHINKMSQISNRYLWHGALEVDSMLAPCKLTLCIIIIIIIIIINGRENKFPSAIIITCRPILTYR